MAGCWGLFLCLCWPSWELPVQLWFLTGLFDWCYFWRIRKQVWEVSQVTNKYIDLSALGAFFLFSDLSVVIAIIAARTDCPEKQYL